MHTSTRDIENLRTLGVAAFGEIRDSEIAIQVRVGFRNSALQRKPRAPLTHFQENGKGNMRSNLESLRL